MLGALAQQCLMAIFRGWRFDRYEALSTTAQLIFQKNCCLLLEQDLPVCYQLTGR